MVLSIQSRCPRCPQQEAGDPCGENRGARRYYYWREKRCEAVLVFGIDWAWWGSGWAHSPPCKPTPCPAGQSHPPHVSTAGLPRASPAGSAVHRGQETRPDRRRRSAVSGAGPAARWVHPPCRFWSRKNVKKLFKRASQTRRVKEAKAMRGSYANTPRPGCMLLAWPHGRRLRAFNTLTTLRARGSTLQWGATAVRLRRRPASHHGF